MVGICIVVDRKIEGVIRYLLVLVAVNISFSSLRYEFLYVMHTVSLNVTDNEGMIYSYCSNHTQLALATSTVS